MYILYARFSIMLCMHSVVVESTQEEIPLQRLCGELLEAPLRLLKVGCTMNQRRPLRLEEAIQTRIQIAVHLLALLLASLPLQSSAMATAT